MEGPKIVATINLIIVGFESADQLKELCIEINDAIEKRGWHVENGNVGVGIAIPKGMVPDELLKKMKDSSQNGKPGKVDGLNIPPLDLTQYKN